VPGQEPAPNPPLPCAATLMKPFALDMLLDTVKNVLRAIVPIGKPPFSLPATIRGQEANQAREWLLPSPGNAARPIAVILSVRGKCDYSQDGVSFAKLERGHVLKQGAIVRTGQVGRTDLLFRRTGTSIRLQAGTEIRLEKMALTIQDGLPVVHTLLALHTGRLLTVVHSTVAGSTLEIRNAAGRAVADARGLSRCIITADGTHVWAQGSAIPIKVRGENGRTIIAAGEHLAGKDGAKLPVSNNLGQRPHPTGRAPGGHGNVRGGGTVGQAMSASHPSPQPLMAKARARRKPLTFGDFVAGVYHAWGERQAIGIVRLAIEVHVIEFRGTERFIIS